MKATEQTVSEDGGVETLKTDPLLMEGIFFVNGGR